MSRKNYRRTSGAVSGWSPKGLGLVDSGAPAQGGPVRRIVGDELAEFAKRLGVDVSRSAESYLREEHEILRELRAERGKPFPVSAADMKNAWQQSPKARPGGVPRERPLPSELWPGPRKLPG